MGKELFAEFVRMPRGSYRYATPDRDCDIWRMGEGWRWTVLDNTSGTYLASGLAATDDLAMEAALLAAGV